MMETKNTDVPWFKWRDTVGDCGKLRTGDGVVHIGLYTDDGHRVIWHDVKPAKAREIARNLIRLADYVDAQSKGAE